MDYNQTMFIMLVLFSGLSFAQDMSSEKYCFSTISAAQAEKKLAAILVPSDVVTKDENCLIVQMRPHRRELIQRYVLSSIPGTSISFSSEDVRREPCKLKVEKIKNKNANDQQIGFDGNIIANRTTTEGSGTETMEIQTLKDFDLSVDQDEIKGSCRFINPTRYEITIQVRKNPKPITPVIVPAGTIVVTNQAPNDQETALLETTLQLNNGERIEIGEIVKKLKDKSTHADIKDGLNNETTQQNIREKVFLSLQ